MSGAPQRLVRAFVGESRGKDLARLHVQPDAVDHRPVDTASHGGVQLAHAAERQVDLHRLLVKSGWKTIGSPLMPSDATRCDATIFIFIIRFDFVQRSAMRIFRRSIECRLSSEIRPVNFDRRLSILSREKTIKCPSVATVRSGSSISRREKI